MTVIKGKRSILIDSIHEDGGKLEFSGTFYYTDEAEPYVPSEWAFRRVVGGKEDDFPVKVLYEVSETVKSKHNKLPAKGIRFSCGVPVEPGRENRIRLVRCGEKFAWHAVLHGWFSPLTNQLRFCYCRESGWILTFSKEDLLLRPETRGRVFACEALLWVNLLKKFSPAAWKALFLRVVYAVCAPRKKRPLWLFADRVNKADDNARALFEYVCSLPRTPESPRFVFTVSGTDEERRDLEKVGEVHPILGWRYKVDFVLADFLISAYRTQAQRMPFSRKVIEYAKDLVNRPKFVFLRHGISICDMSNAVGRAQVNARIMLSGAPRECESILSGNYGYTTREVKLCGLPRYDRLYHDERRCVTFMPTWRNYLVTRKGAYVHKVTDAFADSPFFRVYRELFSDRELKELCEKTGYTLQLMMHPNMLDSLEALEIGPHVRILPLEMRYRDIFAQSDVLVTDYSSVAFDFAYLKKPILYFQFDKDEFFSEHCDKGYFDYDRDAFGDVETDLRGLVSRLRGYLEGDCKMKPEYVKRVDDFFAFTDKNNCKRIYEAILEASREE